MSKLAEDKQHGGLKAVRDLSNKRRYKPRQLGCDLVVLCPRPGNGL